MIKLTQQTSVQETPPTQSGLENLISAMQESYHIPASLVSKMRSGLENTLYEYLAGFVVENGLSEQVQTESSHLLVLPDELGDTDSILSSISESCRLNSHVQIQYKGRNLLSICNESESATYQLGDVDIDKLDSSALLEAWNCPDIDHMIPLVRGILDQLKEVG